MNSDLQFFATATAAFVLLLLIFQLGSVRVGEQIFGLSPAFAKAAITVNVSVVLVWVFVIIVSRSPEVRPAVSVLFTLSWFAAVFSPIAVAAIGIFEAVVIVEALFLKRRGIIGWHIASLAIAVALASALFPRNLSG